VLNHRQPTRIHTREHAYQPPHARPRSGGNTLPEVPPPPPSNPLLPQPPLRHLWVNLLDSCIALVQNTPFSVNDLCVGKIPSWKCQD